MLAALERAFPKCCKTQKERIFIQKERSPNDAKPIKNPGELLKIFESWKPKEKKKNEEIKKKSKYVRTTKPIQKFSPTSDDFYSADSDESDYVEVN